MLFTLRGMLSDGFIGLTEHEVRRQFQEEEEAEARKGVAVKHKVSPGTFITECLEVEEEQ